MAVVRSVPAFVIALCSSAALLSAQTTAAGNPLERAMDFEGKAKFREAAAEYRKALADSGNFAVALLGFERSLHEAGQVDSVLPVVDSLVKVRPADQVVRSVQLRTLRMLGQSTRLAAAFDAWRQSRPQDAAPYREYARLLLEDGRLEVADSVLREAEILLSDVRALSMELAQVRGALGFWDVAARSWRNAVEDAYYLERAAVFALTAAPADKRDTIRAVLAAPPAVPAVRQALASLELGWGSANLAWRAIADLPRNDSTRLAWLAFAERAEAVRAWLPVRDALLAVLDLGGERDPEIVARAARAAVSGGDAQGAFDLVAKEARGMPAADAARLFGVVHVRALATLGQAEQAQTAAERYAPLAPFLVTEMQQEVAWGWIRAGDVVRARRALAAGGDEDEASDIGGWIALYAGDLKGARALLRGYGDATRFSGTITAMAILGRTRADSGVRLGAAFLALSRGDSTASAANFEAAANELPDAASLLLVTAARLRLLTDTSASIALWQRIVEQHGTSPEAAEADLEWARVLRHKGDRSGAVARLEHLILSYPGSALVPQARRELESIKTTIPPLVGAAH